VEGYIRPGTFLPNEAILGIGITAVSSVICVENEDFRVGKTKPFGGLRPWDGSTFTEGHEGNEGAIFGTLSSLLLASDRQGKACVPAEDEHEVLPHGKEDEDERRPKTAFVRVWPPLGQQNVYWWERRSDVFGEAPFPRGHQATPGAGVVPGNISAARQHRPYQNGWGNPVQPGSVRINPRILTSSFLNCSLKKEKLVERGEFGRGWRRAEIACRSTMATQYLCAFLPE
jgi:hypothetical protein